MSITWTGYATLGDDVSFRVGRSGDDLVAEWPDVATLRCARDGGRVAFEVCPAVPEVLANKLRRGPVPALLRHLRGELSLHAATAAYEGTAIAFLGNPSAGKSTIVGHLCQRGWIALSDDILPVDAGWCALPSDPLLWLEPDALRFLGHGTQPTEVIGAVVPVPLAALVTLRFDDGEPSLRALHGAEAIAAVTAAHVRFVLDEPRIHARDMELLFALLESIPIYELVRPRDLKQMNQSAVLLECLVGDLPPRRCR